MSKKWIIPVSIISCLVVVSGGFVAWNRYKNNPQALVVPISSQAESIPQVSPTPVPFVTHEDPAGFTFQYPQDMQRNDHPENKDDYAQVELTHSEHPGQITIWAKDPPLDSNKKLISSVSTWITTSPELIGGSVIDTTIGGDDAKKILIVKPSRKTVIATFHDGLIFYIEAYLEDSAYWNKAVDQIVNSFVFSSVSVPASEESAVSQDAQSAEEEVIE